MGKLANKKASQLFELSKSGVDTVTTAHTLIIVTICEISSPSFSPRVN